MAVTVSGTGSTGVLVVGRDAAFCRRLSAQLRTLARRLPLHLLPPAVGADPARRAAPVPGVALLDLGLPDAQGYALARAWERSGPRLVLLLPSLDSLPQAERLRAADLLVPPIRIDRLEQALRRALGTGQSPDALMAQGREGTVAVPVDEVLYLRADGKYVSLRTRQGEFLTDRALADLSRAFPERFIQVHRNALVARSAIAGARQVTPELTGGDADPYWELLLHGVPDRIAVARRRWPLVRRCLPQGQAAQFLSPEAI